MHGPSLGIETFLCNDDDGHTKKSCCPVSKFVVVVWDGLDESEISRPEILFQSAPAHNIYIFKKNMLILNIFIYDIIYMNINIYT